MPVIFSVKHIDGETMREEDVLKVLVDWLRSPDPVGLPRHGYDMYVPSVIRLYLRKTMNIASSITEDQELDQLFPVFANAAWELCRRGVLRPGINRYRAQATDEGSAGSGFSMTPFGKQWLSEAQEDIFVPTEPERFAELLKRFSVHFGVGFQERAQEAVRCYGAHAYLACCAMCGAAAESILLAAAIAKNHDEEHVLRQYATSKGRTRVENIVIGQAIEHTKREFKGLTELLKYWRDEAAHGTASNISDNEAYTSLAMLLRYAMFVDKNWESLTS